MHPAKRRRLDAAASPLSRPFRSPLRVDSKERNSIPPEGGDGHRPQGKPSVFPSTSSQVARSTAALSPLAESSPSRVTNRPQRYIRSLSAPRPSLLPSPTRSVTRDPDLIAAQKQHNALLLQLKEVSSALDTAVQALEVIKSNKNDELDTLTLKWRNAARDAAETLFSTAKERVDGMGGIGVWRRKRMASETQPVWDDTFDVDDYKLTDDQREQLKMAREDAQLEARKYGPQAVPNTDVDDENIFTIGTMLEQLNVDPKVLGYDAQEQQWID